MADAVPWNDGWLLAYSGPLDCASGTGEPNHIHVDYVAPDGAREPVALFAGRSIRLTRFDCVH